MRLAVVFLFGFLAVSAAQMDVWKELGGVIIKNLKSLWQSGNFELMGHRCRFKVSPKIRKFKLKYKGKLWCPGWTGITGRSSKKSRSGAIEHSVRDFVNKARNSGLISVKDAEEFLRKYS